MRLSQKYQKEELNQLVKDTWNAEDEDAVLFIEEACEACLALYRDRHSLLLDLKAWRLIAPVKPEQTESPRAYVEYKKAHGAWLSGEVSRQAHCDRLGREMVATIGPTGIFPVGVWVRYKAYGFYVRRRQSGKGYAITVELWEGKEPSV